MTAEKSDEPLIASSSFFAEGKSLHAVSDDLENESSGFDLSADRFFLSNPRCVLARLSKHMP
jgi:hypothetical protein